MNEKGRNLISPMSVLFLLVLQLQKYASSSNHSKSEHSYGVKGSEPGETDERSSDDSRQNMRAADARGTRKSRNTFSSTVHPRLDIVPKLMIFEPDRLLWPFHYENDVALPYDLVQPSEWPLPKPKGRRWCTGNFGGRELVDDNGKCLQLNYDALILFLKLKRRGIQMAVSASIYNTSKTVGMKHLIRLFEFEDLFNFSEMDECSAVEHVKRIKVKSGLQFRDLVYLGCNKSTLQEIDQKLKVITVYVDPEKGLDVKDVQEGARLYAIRPHVPMSSETPLTVGKIVSDEAAANVYGEEVMKMCREEDSESSEDSTAPTMETAETFEFEHNITTFEV